MPLFWPHVVKRIVDPGDPRDPGDTSQNRKLALDSQSLPKCLLLTATEMKTIEGTFQIKRKQMHTAR